MVRTRSQANNDPTYTHESIDYSDESDDDFEEQDQQDQLNQNITLNDSINNDVFYENGNHTEEQRQLARIIRHELNTAIVNFFQVFNSMRVEAVVDEEEEESSEQEEEEGSSENSDYDGDSDGSSEPSDLPSVRVNTFEIPLNFVNSNVNCLQAEDFQTLTTTQLKFLCSRYAQYTQYDGSYELTDLIQILQLLTKIPRETVVRDCPICLHAAWTSHELMCCHQILCDTCHCNVQGVCPYCRHGVPL